MTVLIPHPVRDSDENEHSRSRGLPHGLPAVLRTEALTPPAPVGRSEARVMTE
jgi:hypothetical protein